jgi:hypothetical protein
VSSPASHAAARPPAARTIEPSGYGEDGRPVGGGLTESTSTSASYDPKTGELTRSSTAQENPRLSGKVKLRLTLAANGRVESWSVSEKG